MSDAVTESSPLQLDISRATVIAAALRTGVLAALAEGGGTAPELAKELALDERALDLTLGALCTLGFAHREGGRFAPSAELERYLTRTSMGAASLLVWGHVESFLKSGEPMMRADGGAAERQRVYKQAVSGLARRWQQSAEVLADALGPAPREILDVGAGSGVWSLAVAARRDDSRVTALDLPDVLPRFAALAEERGLSTRTAQLSGSWFDVEVPPASFDLVVLANVLHLEREPEAHALVERIAPAVAPGGRVVVIDAISDRTPERERDVALYALHLGMRTRHGVPHGRDTLEGWLTGAGLLAPDYVPLPHGAALVARRPG